MGRIIEEDKRLVCGAFPADFFTLLASCAMVDADSGDIYCNVIPYTVACEKSTPAIDCDKGAPTNPEAFCAANFFALDECGHLGLKIGASAFVSQQE